MLRWTAATSGDNSPLGRPDKTGCNADRAPAVSPVDSSDRARLMRVAVEFGSSAKARRYSACASAGRFCRSSEMPRLLTASGVAAPPNPRREDA